MFGFMIGHHSNGSGADFRRKFVRRLACHRPYFSVSARLLPQDKCLDTGDDLFVVDEAIEELLPIFG